MNGTALRLGVVGFGKLVQNYYVPAFHRLKDVRVIAVADPLAVRREKAKSTIPLVKTYSSHTELLLHEPLAGILVASPPSTHLQIWNDLSKHGIPVFIEKPFVLPGQLRQVVTTRPERSPLMVNFNRRLWPMYQRLRELVQSGRIGDIEGAEFRLHVNIRPWISVTEHRLWPSEGGALYDLGSQVLDLIYFVFDKEPIRIQTECPSANQITLAVELPDGLTVRAHVGYDHHNRESIFLRGSKGGIRIHNPNMTIHLLKKDQSAATLPSVEDWMMLGYRALRRERSMLRYTIQASLSSFIEAIRARKRFTPGFEDAIRNALWLETAHQSLQTGKPVLVHDIKEQSACLM